MSADRVLGWLPAVTTTFAILMAGCSSNDSPTSTGSGGMSAGSAGSGGSMSSAVSSSAGGASAGSTSSEGGSKSSGGESAVAGASGATTRGGSSAATGGASTRTGGTTGTGDASSAKGGSATGGSTNTGETSSAKGGTATGGATAGGTGGRTGGSTGAGGQATGGTGGTTSTGGSTGTGDCPMADAFKTWDSGKGPAEIGKQAVENFKPRTSETYGGDGYAWTFGYVGALQFTETTGDTTNNDYLVGKFDCNQKGPDNGTSASVDTRAFGDLPLEIFIQTQKAACKTLGLARADAQWTRTSSDGITSDARYWIDDMYMITSLQVFAYRATKDIKYLDRTAKTMLSYINELQKNNDTKTDGLFWHTKQSKAYWGRANGWVASGMTELLLDLPAGDNRTKIMAAYKKQMDALLQHQITSGTDVGAWRQVIDRSDAKPEMSCTAMFTFALTTGVKNGWLTDEKYATAAVNGWKALANRTSNGALSQVCPGTGQAAAGDLASQQKFYMDIAFQANDRHGQGPELWAANALLRKDCPGLR
jgi:unsaturated rhamnogalacturonyl hydrolase